MIDIDIVNTKSEYHSFHIDNIKSILISHLKWIGTWFFFSIQKILLVTNVHIVLFMNINSIITNGTVEKRYDDYWNVKIWWWFSHTHIHTYTPRTNDTYWKFFRFFGMMNTFWTVNVAHSMVVKYTDCFRKRPCVCHFHFGDKQKKLSVMRHFCVRVCVMYDTYCPGKNI